MFEGDEMGAQDEVAAAEAHAQMQQARLNYAQAALWGVALAGAQALKTSQLVTITGGLAPEYIMRMLSTPLCAVNPLFPRVRSWLTVQRPDDEGKPTLPQPDDFAFAFDEDRNSRLAYMSGLMSLKSGEATQKGLSLLYMEISGRRVYGYRAVDCAALLNYPGNWLTPSTFDPAQPLHIEGLTHLMRACDARLFTAPDLPALKGLEAVAVGTEVTFVPARWLEKKKGR